QVVGRHAPIVKLLRNKLRDADNFAGPAEFESVEGRAARKEIDPPRDYDWRAIHDALNGRNAVTAARMAMEQVVPFPLHQEITQQRGIAGAYKSDRYGSLFSLSRQGRISATGDYVVHTEFL